MNHHSAPKSSHSLEEDALTRAHWLEVVHAFADQFLASLPFEKAYSPAPENFDTAFNFCLPEEGQPIESALEWIKQSVIEPGINPASGRHLGYVPGGGVYASALGDYIAAVTNRYAGIYYANPGAVKLENSIVRWMLDLIGYSSEATGHLASGGSIANLTALVAARDHLNLLQHPVQQVCIYLTEHVHHCIFKALRICGLGESQIRPVRMDANLRMDVQHLENLIQEDIQWGRMPAIVVASLGTTDAGAIDPISAINHICKKYHLWLHVDGAYGGAFLLLHQVKSKLKGLEETDSFVLDPHKGFFIPYGTGAVLIRHTASVLKSQYYQANYMQDAYHDPAELSPADISPELTKHFRGLRLWLPFYLYGLKAFRDTLAEKLTLAQWFYNEIKDLGFDTIGPPDLSIVLYRTPDENMNKQILQYIQGKSNIFISSTNLDGNLWLRAAIVSFRTHQEHVQELLDSIKKAMNL